jgi:hypothetical protein
MGELKLRAEPVASTFTGCVTNRTSAIRAGLHSPSCSAFWRCHVDDIAIRAAMK